MTKAYYNENDLFAAHWLYNLVQRNFIAPGDIDTRDIRDVRPIDLKPYTQCHFFAGIGVWSHALRRAGWRDDRQVWTGSCPCQPFSAAGKGGGFADERHLWPAFHHLIAQCCPDVVLGEQVASKDGLAWFDLVQSDLEGSGYAAGAVDSCSAGFGAPHIRQRLYWMAYHQHDGQRQHGDGVGGTPRADQGEVREGTQRIRTSSSDGSAIDLLAYRPLDNAADARHDNARQHDGGSSPRAARFVEPGTLSGLAQSNEGQRRSGWTGAVAARGSLSEFAGPGALGELADAGCERVRAPRCETDQGAARGDESTSGERQRVRSDVGASGAGVSGVSAAGPTNGLWRDADWLLCRDGKWRPVESGTFPLAHGDPARVGRLRAYGNAINAEQATAFCEVAKEFLL